MKDVFFGLGLNYGDGAEPSIGINVDQHKVVAVHSELEDDEGRGKTALCSRVGMVDETTVHWPFAAQKYTGGVEPCVAVKPGNTAGPNVVEVHRSESRDALFSMVGTIKGTRVEWKESTQYTSGARPAVAINGAGTVVEVHSVGSALFYQCGTIGTDSVKWQTQATLYDSGQRPRVAINKHNQVVEVHQSTNSATLWYHVGTLGLDALGQWNISFGESHRFASPGAAPSVALTDTGSVIVVYAEADDRRGDRLMQRFGQIDMNLKTIDWNDEAVAYDEGATPYVAASGDGLAMEVHQGESLKTLWFVTSLITDRTKWMTDDSASLGPRRMSELVLPASHDSAMYTEDTLSVLGKTQNLSIANQLEYGIRYFDLRPKWTGAKFIIHHGPVPGPDLSVVLEEIKDFAQHGDKELIILTFSHFEGFDKAVYTKFANQVEQAIGTWLWKTKLAAGQRLADITLNTYTAAQTATPHTAIVLAVDDDHAINLKKDGFWVFRNWDSKTADKGDLRVFDQYSNTTGYDAMKDDQLLKFAAYNGRLAEFPDLPCDLFLLSWTLTPATAVWSYSMAANRNLGQVMSTLKDPNGYGKIINMVYVDYVQYARVTDVAITQN